MKRPHKFRARFFQEIFVFAPKINKIKVRFNKSDVIIKSVLRIVKGGYASDVTRMA